jgi:predicted DNA-binding transcriptional regulator AlpA
MGAQEIQRRLGFSRQWTSQIINRRTFPAPLATLAMGQVWLAQDVEDWIVANRPQVDEDDLA